MTRRLLIAVCLLMAGCSNQGKEIAATPVIRVTDPVEQKVLVAVECTETVRKTKVDSDTMTADEDLESKIEKLLRSDAQHRVYINKLEQAGVTCGVRILRD